MIKNSSQHAQKVKHKTRIKDIATTPTNQPTNKRYWHGSIGCGSTTRVVMFEEALHLQEGDHILYYSIGIRQIDKCWLIEKQILFHQSYSHSMRGTLCYNKKMIYILLLKEETF